MEVEVQSLNGPMLCCKTLFYHRCPSEAQEPIDVNAFGLHNGDHNGKFEIAGEAHVRAVILLL